MSLQSFWKRFLLIWPWKCFFAVRKLHFRDMVIFFFAGYLHSCLLAREHISKVTSYELTLKILDWVKNCFDVHELRINWFGDAWYFTSSAIPFGWESTAYIYHSLGFSHLIILVLFLYLARCTSMFATRGKFSYPLKACPNGKCFATKHHQTLFGDQTCWCWSEQTEIKLWVRAAEQAWYACAHQTCLVRLSKRTKHRPSNTRTKEMF